MPLMTFAVASSGLRTEPRMRHSDHFHPLNGPSSDPVLHGVARGLAEIFPPVELSVSHDEADEQANEDDQVEQVG